MRFADPGSGSVGHAEIKIGSALVMLADEYPDMEFLSPTTVGGSPVMIHIYVPDVDATCARAQACGAEVINEPKTQFYGDRSCKLKDPFGHVWIFTTHVEDVAPDELERRARELHGNKAGAET
jgi:PhnB protein